MEQTTPKMPPEIAKAVVEVMGKVKTLGKEETNKHGGYKYVSVDQFFEKIGPLMSAAGIFVLTTEVSSSTEVRETTDSYGKTKSSAWLTTEYDILLVHESGVTFGPIRRNQQVSATGPQSYGASEAYVEKYFLRNLFKIPTGEADADAEAQEGLPAKRNIPVPPKPPAHPSDRYTKYESNTARDLLLSTMIEAKSYEELSKWQADNIEVIGKLLEEDREKVREEFADIRQALRGREAAE